VLTAKGDFNAAAAALKLVLAAAPDLPVALALMGDLELRRRNLPAARRLYTEALSRDGSSLEALGGYLTLLIAEKRTPEAIKLVEQRLQATPKDADVLMLAARVYSILGKGAQEEKALLEVVKVQPGNVAALVTLGNLYVAQNKLDLAKARFEELSQGPASVGAQTMLGLALQAQNRPLDARTVYEQLLAAHPDVPVAANNLAYIYAETGGNLDKALQLAQDAVRLKPDSADYNDTLGWVYLKKDLHSQAINAFQTSVKLNPRSPEFHYHLGLAYLRGEQFQKAGDELRAAIKLKPDYRDAQLSLDLVNQEAAKKKR
jgi:tetratricopeptide (TPR) repeat protein